jgi:hypothetical protein
MRTRTLRWPFTGGETLYLLATLFCAIWVPPLGLLLAGFGIYDRSDQRRSPAFIAFVALFALAAAIELLLLVG